MAKTIPDNIFVFALLTAGLVIVLAAASLPADAADSSAFTASATVTSASPTIDWVESIAAVDLTADSSTAVYINFNASDANGVSDLNDSSATIVVELGSETATSSSCAVAGTSGNTNQYNCTLSLPYHYNESASWSINASISDNGENYVEDTAQTFTINRLEAIALTQASLSWSGSPGTDNVLASEGEQRVRNTGNYDFPTLNLTAYDLINGTDEIAASSFTMDDTASGGTGDALVNATAVTLSGADMTHGDGAFESAYIYLDIPAGLPEGEYSAEGTWTFTAG